MDELKAQRLKQMHKKSKEYSGIIRHNWKVPMLKVEQKESTLALSEYLSDDIACNGQDLASCTCATQFFRSAKEKILSLSLMKIHKIQFSLKCFAILCEKDDGTLFQNIPDNVVVSLQHDNKSTQYNTAPELIAQLRTIIDKELQENVHWRKQYKNNYYSILAYLLMQDIEYNVRSGKFYCLAYTNYSTHLKALDENGLQYLVHALEKRNTKICNFIAGLLLTNVLKNFTPYLQSDKDEIQYWIKRYSDGLTLLKDATHIPQLKPIISGVLIHTSAIQITRERYDNSESWQSFCVNWQFHLDLMLNFYPQFYAYKALCANRTPSFTELKRHVYPSSSIINVEKKDKKRYEKPTLNFI